MTESAPIRCSFCTKTQDEVRKLVSGGPENNVYICDECVDQSSDIIFGEMPSVVRPLRMAARALWWRIVGWLPWGETPPSSN